MLGQLFGARLGLTVISTIVTVGFFGILVLLLLKPVMIAGDASELLKVFCGILGAKFSDVVGYHINSSAGSKAKDDLIAAHIQKQSQAR